MPIDAKYGFDGCLELLFPWFGVKCGGMGTVADVSGMGVAILISSILSSCEEPKISKLACGEHEQAVGLYKAA